MANRKTTSKTSSVQSHKQATFVDIDVSTNEHCAIERMQELLHQREYIQEWGFLDICSALEASPAFAEFAKAEGFEVSTLRDTAAQLLIAGAFWSKGDAAEADFKFSESRVEKRDDAQ